MIPLVMLLGFIANTGTLMNHSVPASGASQTSNITTLSSINITTLSGTPLRTIQ